MDVVTLDGRTASGAPLFTPSLRLTRCLTPTYLFKCIHARPALWEKTIKEFSDKHAKEKSWFEVTLGETCMKIGHIWNQQKETRKVRLS